MPIFAAPVLVAAPPGGRGASRGRARAGYRIQTGVLHAFMNVVDHRMRIQRAIDHPRVHCQGRETCVDGRIPAAVRRRLARAGHEVVVVDEDPGTLHFGRVAAVTREPRSGVLRAGAGAGVAYRGGGVLIPVRRIRLLHRRSGASLLRAMAH